MLRQTGVRRELGDFAWTPIAAYLPILPKQMLRTPGSLAKTGRRLISARLKPCASCRPARLGRTSAACRCAHTIIGPACSTTVIFPRSKTSIRKTCPISGHTASCSISPAGSKTPRFSSSAPSLGWNAAPAARLPRYPMCRPVRYCPGSPITTCRSWLTRRQSGLKPNSSISANRRSCIAGSCCRSQATMTRSTSFTG